MALDNRHNVETKEMNVEQWRRDVKAFVATTMQEIDQITDQLAGEVADPASRSVSPNTQSSDSCDDRLSRLKQKLSRRS